MTDKTTVFGKMLTRVQQARIMTRKQAIGGLWQRNGLDTPTLREGYKLAETKMTHRDGTEVVEYRLYKLIDAAVSTISSEVASSVEVGVEGLRENRRDLSKYGKD